MSSNLVLLKISTREFTRNPTPYIARVTRGETFELTRYDEIVAVLGPPNEQPGQARSQEPDGVAGVSPALVPPPTRDGLLRNINRQGRGGATT